MFECIGWLIRVPFLELDARTISEIASGVVSRYPTWDWEPSPEGHIVGRLISVQDHDDAYLATCVSPRGVLFAWQGRSDRYGLGRSIIQDIEQAVLEDDIRRNSEGAHEQIPRAEPDR